MSNYAGHNILGGSYQPHADYRQQNNYIDTGFEYDQNYSATGDNSYNTTDPYSVDTNQDGSSSQTYVEDGADYDNNSTYYGYDDQSTPDDAYSGHDNVDNYEVEVTGQDSREHNPVPEYHNYSSGTISTYSSNIENFGTSSVYSQTSVSGVPNGQTRGSGAPNGPTRGFGVPFHQTRGSGVPFHQTRGSGEPFHQTRGSRMPYNQTRGFRMPYNQTRGFRMPYNQTRGFSAPYSMARGPGRGHNRFPGINERGTGRGHFNPPMHAPSHSQGPGQKYGQFGRYIPNTDVVHVQHDKKDPNKGQFNLPTGGSDSTVTVDKSGQFGIPLETTTPETDSSPTATKSNPPSTTPSSQQLTEKDENEEADGDLSEDTDFCKYCKLAFTSQKAYHLHTRGVQHTTLVMQAKSEKGDTNYQKEKVDASVLGKDENEEADSDSSEEDTEFCKYCKLAFTSQKAYHMHTRGLQHTTLVMQAKSEKGDINYQKEKVDASVLEVNIPAPQLEGKEEEDDTWVSLEEIMDTIKHKKHTEGLDLHPNDIGKSQLPSEFDCPLCDIQCTGASAFKMHIDGRQHKRHIEAAQQGVTLRKRKPLNSGIMVETKERSSKFSEMIKDNRSPMLGVEFVTEFQKKDLRAAPRYVCNLCESKCDGSTIIPHLIGLKHRLHYMQHKNPSMYEHLTKYNSKKKKSVMNASLEDFAREMEQKNGRGEVKIKIELDSMPEEDDLQESMLRHSKALAEKVKEVEEGKIVDFHENAFPSKTVEPLPKKPRLARDVAADRRAVRAALGEIDNINKDPNDRERSPCDDRKTPFDDRRDHPLDDRRSPFDDRRSHTRDDRRSPCGDRRSHTRDDRRSPFDDRRSHMRDDRRSPFDDRRSHTRDDRRSPFNDRRSHTRDDRSPFDDHRNHTRDDRRSPFDDRRNHPLDDRRSPCDDRRNHTRDDRRSPFDDRRSHTRDDRRSPFDDRRNHPLDDRRQPFDDRRNHTRHGRERTAHDFRTSYKDQFDQSRRDDPVYERRMYEERKTLDDPYSERQRVDDIVERRRCLDDLERDRFSDILERRKRLQESDVDFLRMKRFSERETATSSSPSLSTDEEKRLQDLLARRRALMTETNSRTPITETSPQTLVMETSPQTPVTETIPRTSMMETKPKRIKTQIEAIQDKLAFHMSSDPDMADKQIKAAVALREEAAKNPDVNIGELMSTLSSSIITTGDNASMSLQITNGLTLALLKHRLQIVPSKPSAIAEYTGGPLLEKKVADPTLPGLGTSTSSSNVPAFLRTSQRNAQSTNPPQYNYSATTQSLGNVLYPAYSQQQQQQKTEAAPAAGVSVAAGVSAAKTHSQNNSLFNTLNIDQPQKFLLESIRKQTEILKEKIKASSTAVGVNASSTTINVQSQSKHLTNSTQAVSYANLYSSQTSSSANPVAASSLTYQASAVTNPVASTGNGNTPSQYSAQYYKHNYQSIPPNAAPETVPSASSHDKRASIPVQAMNTKLPTNDLPPLRRNRHR